MEIALPRRTLPQSSARPTTLRLPLRCHRLQRCDAKCTRETVEYGRLVTVRMQLPIADAPASEKVGKLHAYRTDLEYLQASAACAVGASATCALGPCGVISRVPGGSPHPTPHRCIAVSNAAHTPFSAVAVCSPLGSAVPCRLLRRKHEPVLSRLRRLGHSSARCDARVLPHARDAFRTSARARVLTARACTDTHRTCSTWSRRPCGSRRERRIWRTPEAPTTTSRSRASGALPISGDALKACVADER